MSFHVINNCHLRRVEKNVDKVVNDIAPVGKIGCLKNKYLTGTYLYPSV